MNIFFEKINRRVKSKMVPLICITISTKYDDILELIIEQNIQFFTKWYIVTDMNDSKTINVIKKHQTNHDNIEILYYDFWKNKAKFNKGGAVKYVQEIVYEKYKDKDIFVLLLDSDIYIPNNFKDIYQNMIKIPSNLGENILYGPEHRYDYSKYSDFRRGENYQIYYLDQKHMGFFQLYYVKKESNYKYLYENSVNCASCDSIFRNRFGNRIIIKNLVVSHLGIPKINWNTRKNTDDFLIDFYINLPK